MSASDPIRPNSTLAGPIAGRYEANVAVTLGCSSSVPSRYTRSTQDSLRTDSFNIAPRLSLLQAFRGVRPWIDLTINLTERHVTSVGPVQDVKYETAESVAKYYRFCADIERLNGVQLNSWTGLDCDVIIYKPLAPSLTLVLLHNHPAV